MKRYSEYQFAFFRIIFGLYLLIHFAELIPFAAEIFSNQGMLPDASLNFTARIFPNLFLLFDSPAGARVFMAALALLAFFYMIGFYRRFVSVFLWYGMACLFNRNNLIANPALPYLGWLLLASALIPSGEALSVDKRRIKKDLPPDFFPPLIYWGAWILLAAGYLISGYAKLKSPSWADGTALAHLAANPLARDYFLCKFFAGLPALVLKLKTWGALALELFFLPLCLSKRTRFLAWAGSVFMHLGILFIVDFTDLTLGILVFHLFIFDPAWLPAVPSRGDKPVVFFDGVCKFCDGAVNFFLKEDKEAVLKFSPLQGDFARKNIGGREMTSLVYLDESGLHRESVAFIKILWRIGGMWRLISVFLILIPPFIRNGVYRWIAASRYRWFGKKDQCRVPSMAERSRFIN